MTGFGTLLLALIFGFVAMLLFLALIDWAAR
jgi:hypothetical protein